LSGERYEQRIAGVVDGDQVFEVHVPDGSIVCPGYLDRWPFAAPCSDQLFSPTNR
jgi:hypothetical protein